MNSGFGSKRNCKSKTAYILSGITALVCCMAILFVFFDIGRKTAVKPDAMEAGNDVQSMNGEREM